MKDNSVDKKVFTPKMPQHVATVPVTCRDVDLDGYSVQLREIVDDDGLPSRTTTLVILFGFGKPVCESHK